MSSSEKFELGPLQKAWIAALRSGEYEQGKESLCRDNKYCCLGVACEAVLKLPHVKSVNESNFQLENGNSIQDSLEYGTFEALGLVDDCGEPTNLVPFVRDFALTVLNDRRGYTFSMIADLLEQHPEWYFKESK